MSDNVLEIIKGASPNMAEANALLDQATRGGFTERLVSAVDLANRDLKPRQWVVKDWIPRGEPSMTGGPPGAGKSLLMQAVATAVSYRNSIYGLELETCPALYLTCEDDLDELQRRQIGICDMLRMDAGLLSNLHLISYRGEDARLAILENGQFRPTWRYAELDAIISEYQLGLVVLDLIPDFFDGNENIRNEVNRFVKGTLGGLAAKHNCAINFLYHPSRSGMADGSGLSGSTAWEGSVRSRLYLTGQDSAGIRTLQRKKSNYSGQDDGFNLEWRDGALHPTEQARVAPCNKPLGKYAKPALDALKELSSGSPVPIGKWRDAWIEQINAEGIESPEILSGAWRDARNQLKKRGHIAQDDNCVVLLD